MFTDTHCHLDMIEDIPIKDLVESAKAVGVEKIIIPAANESSFDKIFEICNNYENIFCMLGIYPAEAKTWTDDVLEKIEKLAKSKKIVGIGEIGLDYYWDTSFKDLQKEIFIKQIILANKLNLPIAVHDRDAHKDCFDILTKYNKSSNVIMHCFSGSVEFAKECVKQGFYLALGGVVTFKNSIKMKEVAKYIPFDKLLLETDAPYLTPVPYRGKTNKPEYIPLIAQEIAKIKEVDIKKIEECTTENAERIFQI